MLTKTLQVLREAMDYRAANSDAVIALVAKMINQPVETVKADAANSQMLDSKQADTYTTDGTFDKWLTGHRRVLHRRRQAAVQPGPEDLLPRRHLHRSSHQVNLLFLMTDQHRVDTLGAYGNIQVRTPHLDELARTGTRFDRWYTPTAICTPARASLLTGQAPFRHKVLANHERNVGYLGGPAGRHVHLSRVALREQGYELRVWSASGTRAREKTPPTTASTAPSCPAGTTRSRTRTTSART